MDTVLIVDGDLGFVFWLGQKLNEIGHRAWPAVTVSDAVALAKRVNPDVLIINRALPDAAQFVESRRRFHEHLRVFALPSGFQARSEYLRDPSAVLRAGDDLGADGTCVGSGVLASVGPRS